MLYIRCLSYHLHLPPTYVNLTQPYDINNISRYEGMMVSSTQDMETVGDSCFSACVSAMRLDILTASTSYPILEL